MREEKMTKKVSTVNPSQIEQLRSILQTIPNEFHPQDYTVELSTDELTSVCPFRGLPDFYKLHVTYIPAKELLELKSLKFYLSKFRNIPITHEALLNVIFEDLANLLHPRYIRIELYVHRRGGIDVVVRREQGEYYDENRKQK